MKNKDRVLIVVIAVVLFLAIALFSGVFGG